jgi:hypothetical protein
MLSAGQRPTISSAYSSSCSSSSSSKEISSLIKIHRQHHPSSGSHKKQNMIEIYSYCDTMIRDNEDWNVKTYDDPYAWLDPPEDIYASNLTSSSSSSSTVISSADSQTVKSSSIEKMTTAPVLVERSFVISTSPCHNRYLSRPQLHWWGLQTSPPLLTRDHRSPAPPYSRLTQYHDDMIQKQKEKAYHERLRNQQWLQSLHVQQQQQGKESDILNLQEDQILEREVWVSVNFTFHFNSF